MQAIEPRVTWLEPMDCEVNINQDTKAIEVFLKEIVDRIMWKIKKESNLILMTSLEDFNKI